MLAKTRAWLINQPSRKRENLKLAFGDIFLEIDIYEKQIQTINLDIYVYFMCHS
jgi:hypothetical protein